ncbi:sensor histidine kinase [Candidatus Nitrosocosmicus arcticus]|uniref:histidine kinase n=1 Tax=Candidatus Nitrosocosmicus arcticus TaxID=2035267 RepID=A0A557SXH0_9ARCH|nr:sensor histidine kinase [Candidatus Nitrosocosmicus arcticus]TVP41293.1 Signal transduction histidine kinase with phosphoacceptor and ATP binding domain [Candidatus Nitrosocosmicus arcticus]
MKLSRFNNVKESILKFFKVNNSIHTAAIFIVIIPLVLFFYFQQETEDSIRSSIFEQQKQVQIDSTRAIAQHLQSDMELILSRLQGLAMSSIIQDGDYTSNLTKSLLVDYYKKINSTTPVDRLFLYDKNGISIIDIAPSGNPSYAGMDFSFRSWVNETKNTMSPVVSDMYVGIDGKNRIAMTHPIITTNSSGSYYNGLVGVVIPINEFFNYYGNIYDIQSQYLAVLDNKGTQLVHPVDSLVGKPFFGNFTQNLTGHNDRLNNLVKTVMSGSPSSEVYQFINSERLNAGYPIIVEGAPMYSVFVITPTSFIYSKINEIIDKERLQMLTLIIGIIAAVLLLILFLSKVNSTLDKSVKRRTKELEDTNRKLEIANRNVQIHDDMQKEFINIAAHELRNPVQSLLGFSDILTKLIGNIDLYKHPMEAINRNAKRLKRLVDIVLEVSQLDSDLLTLNKEPINLKEMITEIMCNYQDRTNGDRKYNIVLEDSSGPNDSKILNADKSRLTQVIRNLIDNALEFTKDEDEIMINMNKTNNGREIEVTISDPGYGIHPDVLPLLFTKFVKKSSRGTGLGLYVSKKIIEAHGGRIWAKNNENGNGVTFGFSLPVQDQRSNPDNFNDTNQ